MIELKDVSKSYGKNIIFDKINFSVKKGISFAIIGKNGKGKSTFLKIISNLINVNEGEIIYKDKNLSFCYIIDNFSDIKLTPKEYLTSVGMLHNMQKDEIEQKIQKLSEDFFYKEMLDTPIKYLSKGSIQKINITQALLYKSDIMLLDEPLSGLDTESAKKLFDYVKEYKKNGSTVILSTHTDYALSQLADEVYEIKDQKIIQVNNSTLLKKSLKKITFNYSNSDFKIGTTLEEQLDNIVYLENNKVELLVSDQFANNVIKALMDNHYVLEEMTNEYI